ncbi:hypothetical protein BJ875DRAFT_235557 [Amylocarpus encephaloides]|uniref:Hydrophobin n=1 Tax=Amylocarpus encephaloides TaxID=45428 RepID=A0A9P7YND4_9HELO|nr:hypothetical protein BJ875DRAFT_235557 [Amylocarpus encephaloides]
MQYSLITALTAAFAVNVMAAPTGDNPPQHSCPSGPATTASPPTEPSPTVPVPTGLPPVSTPSVPVPTGTGPTYPSGCSFTCSWPATIEILNCVNVLTGTTIDIPISALNSPIPEKREVAERTGATKNYCCKPGGLLISALTCVDIATGDDISVPIKLLNGE